MKRSVKRVLSFKSIAAGILVVALIVVGVLYLRTNNSDATKKSAAQGADSASTEQEKQETQAHKEGLATQGQTKKNNPSVDENSSKKSVTPIITYANQNDQEIVVNAYIPELFEDGGTCSFTLQKDSQTITKNTEGFANASTTDCARMAVSRSEFQTGGQWQVTLTYSSSKTEGTSAVVKFEVQ